MAVVEAYDLERFGLYEYEAGSWMLKGIHHTFKSQREQADAGAGKKRRAPSPCDDKNPPKPSSTSTDGKRRRLEPEEIREKVTPAQKTIDKPQEKKSSLQIKGHAGFQIKGRAQSSFASAEAKPSSQPRRGRLGPDRGPPVPRTPAATAWNYFSSAQVSGERARVAESAAAFEEMSARIERERAEATASSSQAPPPMVDPARASMLARLAGQEASEGVGPAPDNWADDV